MWIPEETFKVLAVSSVTNRRPSAHGPDHAPLPIDTALALRSRRSGWYAPTEFFPLSLGNIVMNDRGARLLLATLAGCALLALAGGGCASMRKQKIVPESIAASRQMSRDGVAAMELGQWEESRSLLQEAVSTSPTDIDARRNLAEVLWQMGEHRDAVVHLEAAVRLDPRNAPTVVRSGEMLLAVGAVDSAAERAQQAIALDATLAGAWALRGRVLSPAGR